MRRDQTGAAASSDDVTPRKNDLLLFGGGPGFFPSGTVVDESDAFLTLVDPGGGELGGDTSLAGDGNGDGFPELVIGRPAVESGRPGSVRLRACPPEPAEYSNAAFAEATWEGEDATFGGVLVASGDIDGNGRTDLVVGSGDSGWAGAVYVALR